MKKLKPLDPARQLEKIRDKIVKRYPEKTVCVQCETWHHTSGNKETKYKVSFLPGLSGEVCQQFKFETIAELRRFATEGAPANA